MVDADGDRSGAEDPETVVERMLEERPEGVAAVGRAAVALIRRLDPAAVVVPWPRQGTIGFGIGPRKYSEHYAYLALHPRHVNLGFNQGAELDDPAGLLGGPGRSLRHLRLEGPDALDRAEVAALLRQAREHRAATSGSSGGSRPSA